MIALLSTISLFFLNSIINVQQAVTCHSPNTLINYGSAGAINQALSGLHEVTKFEQRDMDARALGFKIGETPFDPISSINLGRPGLSCGTGDNFVIEGECLSTDLVDMEAYALAKVCHHHDIPFISFKYITDNVNEHSVKDWKENLADGIIEFKDKILSNIER